MPGSPSKYTPERVDRFLEAIRGGSSQRDAAAYAGVDEDTVLNWRKRHSEFSDSYTRAESECAVRMSAHLVNAAREDWRAALSWLERRRQPEWGKTDKLDVTHRHDPVIQQRAAALAAETGQPVETVLAQFDQFAGAAN